MERLLYLRYQTVNTNDNTQGFEPATVDLPPLPTASTFSPIPAPQTPPGVTIEGNFLMENGVIIGDITGHMYKRPIVKGFARQPAFVRVPLPVRQKIEADYVQGSGVSDLLYLARPFFPGMEYKGLYRRVRAYLNGRGVLRTNAALSQAMQARWDRIRSGEQVMLKDLPKAPGKAGFRDVRSGKVGLRGKIGEADLYRAAQPSARAPYGAKKAALAALKEAALVKPEAIVKPVGLRENLQALVVGEFNVYLETIAKGSLEDVKTARENLSGILDAVETTLKFSKQA